MERRKLSRRRGRVLVAIGLASAFSGPVFYYGPSRTVGVLLPLIGFALAASGLWLHNVRGRGRDERQREIERRSAYVALMVFGVIAAALFWLDIYAPGTVEETFQPTKQVLYLVASLTWLSWSLSYLYYRRRT